MALKHFSSNHFKARSFLPLSYRTSSGGEATLGYFDVPPYFLQYHTTNVFIDSHFELPLNKRRIIWRGGDVELDLHSEYSIPQKNSTFVFPAVEPDSHSEVSLTTTEIVLHLLDVLLGFSPVVDLGPTYLKIVGNMPLFDSARELYLDKLLLELHTNLVTADSKSNVGINKEYLRYTLRDLILEMSQDHEAVISRYNHRIVSNLVSATSNIDTEKVIPKGTWPSTYSHVQTDQHIEVAIEKLYAQLHSLAVIVHSGVDTSKTIPTLFLSINMNPIEVNSNSDIGIIKTVLPITFLDILLSTGVDIEKYLHSVSTTEIETGSSLYLEPVKLFRMRGVSAANANSDIFENREMISIESAIHKTTTIPFISVNSQTGLVQSDFTIVVLKNNVFNTTPVAVSEIGQGFYTASITPIDTGTYSVFIDTRLVAYIDVHDKTTRDVIRNIEDEALGNWQLNKISGELTLYRKNGQELAKFNVRSTSSSDSRTLIS